MAVNAIRHGDCDCALIAAANWISDPSMQIVLDKLGALSPTSRCHALDASADGYARGEGYAALYLKKSSLAILDANPILAMIKGTAVNVNGRAGGITRPGVGGKGDVIRRAYENAGKIPFSDTAFFDCHGTAKVEVIKDRTRASGRAASTHLDSEATMVTAGMAPVKFNLLDTLICAMISIDHVNVVLPEYVKPGIMDRSKTSTSNHQHNGSSTNGEIESAMPPHSPVAHSPNITQRPLPSTSTSCPTAVIREHSIYFEL
ncbi:thiolase-like protein [Xylaria longipes]|nr:thiolase-like protein [Xylaria longipes]